MDDRNERKVKCEHCGKMKPGTPQGLCLHCGKFGSIPNRPSHSGD